MAAQFFLRMGTSILPLNVKQEKKHYFMILAQFDNIPLCKNCPFESLAAQKNSLLEGLPKNYLNHELGSNLFFLGSLAYKLVN